MERKFKYNRFGLTENPIGKYIAMPWKDDRVLLGEVIGTSYDSVRGILQLSVRHFCGDMWPISPVPSAVTIIEDDSELPSHGALSLASVNPNTFAPVTKPYRS